MPDSASLFERARHCLLEADPAAKLAAVDRLYRDWQTGMVEPDDAVLPPVREPGRPARPALVAPRELPRRKLSTPAGHGALIHSLCHIEFNAINLALDAASRFRALPRDYYSDWLKVAAEEAYHFGLLRDHLQSLGYAYGDFPAHDGLWEAALDTAHDPMVRMALVPRVLEARGLDVTPGIIDKLARVDDSRAVEILHIIQRDEVGHVAIGSRWFRYLCEQRGLDPETTFRELLSQYLRGSIRGPLDREARRQAGFSEAELDYLEGTG
jgi:uncharacterized ferritin-like protein (DUF455 family)